MASFVVYLAALIYGIQVFFKLVFDTFKYGYSAVWKTTTFPRPAVLDDPSFGTQGFLHLEEVRIHYVASGPEDKPLMLFLHGWPEFWYTWKYQIKEFQKDYRVVAIDQRGFGESDKPDGIESYVVTKLASDVKEVILALGYKKCVLVCHDWGGIVGFRFGRFYPDMVDKLIVMNSFAQAPFGKVMRNQPAQRKMSWYTMFFQVPYLPEIFVRERNFAHLEHLLGGTPLADYVMVYSDPREPMDQESIDAHKYIYSQPGAITPTINWYRAGVQKPAPSYDMDYAMPVLLIWGANDHYLHTDLPAQMKKDYPKLEVRLIKDANHFVHRDAPEEVNKAMRDWLKASEGK